jgi:hypothetical protein
VDPTTVNNFAIRYASQHGHTKIVQLLLAWSSGTKRVDPTDDNDFAFKSANYYNHAEVVQLLLADPRVYAYANR